MGKKLLPKQQRFVAEYMKDLNGKQAAIRAGYSPKTAEVYASKLLSNGKVAEAVSVKSEKIIAKTDLTAQMVIDELRKLAFSNMEDFTKVDENGDRYFDLGSHLTREQLAALGELTIDRYDEGDENDIRIVKKTKFKLSDKTRALEILAKYFKLLTDRIDIGSSQERLSELTIKIKSARPEKNAD
jgi:phage terminase small subunit